MTVLMDIRPFTVTSGKYKFRFLPEAEGGFSVSCVNVKGINAQGDTFEEALRDAISAAAFVEECVADPFHNPENMRVLRDSISDADAGKVTTHELINRTHYGKK